jgi:hypothetical protein
MTSMLCSCLVFCLIARSWKVVKSSFFIYRRRCLSKVGCFPCGRADFRGKRQHACLYLVCSGVPESTVVSTSGATTLTQEPSTSLGSTVVTSKCGLCCKFFSPMLRGCLKLEIVSLLKLKPCNLVVALENLDNSTVLVCTEFT